MQKRKLCSFLVLSRAAAAAAAAASVVSDSVRPHRWQPTRLPHPWDSPGKNTGVGQSILKEINSDYSLEGLMLRLKFQYFGHLMQRTDSLEKTAMLGKIEGRRRRGWQNEMVGWHHRLNGHEFEQAPGDDEGQGSLACCSPWGRKALDMTEQQNNNTLNHQGSIGSWPHLL